METKSANMASCKETKTACVDREDFVSDNGSLRCNHPNPSVHGVAGGLVIDTPLIDLGDGNKFKFQCISVDCKPDEFDTTAAQNEADTEIGTPGQSKPSDSLSKKIDFRPYSKKIEIIFIHEDTPGEGREAPHEVIVVNKLVPASRYRIQITHLMCDKQVGEMERYISTTVPFGPPVNFNVTKGSDGSFCASWEKPQVENECKISHYIISIYSFSQNEYKYCDKKIYDGEYQSAYFTLKEEMIYTFGIQACSEEFMSKSSRRTWSCLKHKMLSNAKVVAGDNGTKTLYLVNTTKTTLHGDVSLIEIGKQPFPDVTQEEKVVFLVGETGAGKTTWINALFNYMLDVKFEDDFRFLVVIEENAAHQEFSQTENINIYKFHPKEGYPISYNLTVIDTPGFGSTNGIESDNLVIKQFWHVVDNQFCFLDHLDAIVFMAKASNERFHPLQEHVLSSFLELFGNDIKDNIYVLCSHGTHKKPQIISALRAANFSFKTYFQFDHAAIFDHIQEPEEEQDGLEGYNNIFYKRGMKSFEEFLSNVTSSQPTSISLTREVLKKRLSLQGKIREVQILVDKGLNQMEQLKNAMDVIEVCDDKLTSHKTRPKKKLYTHSWATVCIDCKHTCHENCWLYFDFTKSMCEVMDSKKSPASCTKCPKKCKWDSHKNLGYIYVEDLEKAVVVIHDRKVSHEKLQKKKITAEEACKQIQWEFKLIDTKMKGHLSEITECIKLLNEIGMKNDKISQMKYIDTLMENEQENTNRPGRRERLALLRGIRKQATELSDIENGEYDPFREYREMAEKIRIKNPDIPEDQVWMEVAKMLNTGEKRWKSVFRWWYKL